MVKSIMIFSMIFMLIWASVITWRDMSRKQKWSLTKSALFSILIAAVTFAVLTFIVILF